MYLPIRIHTWGEPWKSVLANPEKQATVREILQIPDEKKLDHVYGPHWLNYDDMMALNKMGVPFDIDRDELATKTATMVQTLSQKFGAPIDGTPELAGKHITQIAIPDLGLLTINEVMHLNDCCTDNLRDHLKEGWRILAVCPPIAQRRPDYILGRSRSA